MSQSHTIDGISTLHRGERTAAVVLGNRMITIQADLNRPGYLKVEEQTLLGVSPDGRTIAGPVTLSPAVPL